MSTSCSDEKNRNMIWNEELSAEHFLKDYGPELVALGRVIWKLQAEALVEAPFMK